MWESARLKKYMPGLNVDENKRFVGPFVKYKGNISTEIMKMETSIHLWLIIDILLLLSPNCSVPPDGPILYSAIIC